MGQIIKDYRKTMHPVWYLEDYGWNEPYKDSDEYCGVQGIYLTPGDALAAAEARYNMSEGRHHCRVRQKNIILTDAFMQEMYEEQRDRNTAKDAVVLLSDLLAHGEIEEEQYRQAKKRYGSVAFPRYFPESGISRELEGIIPAIVEKFNKDEDAGSSYIENLKKAILSVIRYGDPSGQTEYHIEQATDGSMFVPGGKYECKDISGDPFVMEVISRTASEIRYAIREPLPDGMVLSGMNKYVTDAPVEATEYQGHRTERVLAWEYNHGSIASQKGYWYSIMKYTPYSVSKGII